MKLMLYATIAILSTLLIACDPSGMRLSAEDKADIETVLSGQKIECEFGLNANGRCLKEGEIREPVGEFGCYPFCNVKRDES